MKSKEFSQPKPVDDSSDEKKISENPAIEFLAKSAIIAFTCVILAMFTAVAAFEASGDARDCSILRAIVENAEFPSTVSPFSVQQVHCSVLLLLMIIREVVVKAKKSH